MKKLALAGSALLVVAALSCTRELDIETPVNQEYVFEAVWADGSDTRTALQEDGTSIWWTTGDEINVFYGSIASGKFVSTNTEPAALTSFSGSLPVVTGTVESGHGALSFWGVYPYDSANTCDGESVTLTVSASQPATDGTFADKFFPAVAVSQDFALAFYNVCGGARFSVANTGIYAVTFEAVGGENLVGKVKVGFGSDGKPVVQQVSEGSAEVTVNAPAGGFVPGKYYFAAFLPGTLSQGLKVTYRTATQSASITQPNSLTINRSRFGTIDRKDAGLTFVDGGGAEGGYAMPEAIDLGLSVKWASFNLGATKPEEFGNYYAWGETEPKEDYSWSTYKWCRGTESTLTKYCLNLDYGYNGYSDDNTILDPEDDAATVNLGGNWRMPTMSEWHELINNCTWTKTTQNGKVGYLGISKITGYTNQSIFLPAAGAYGGTTYYGLFDGDEGFGYYLTSLLNPFEPCNALGSGFIFWSDYQGDSYFDEEIEDEFTRCVGVSVRPVYGSGAPAVQVESVSLDKSEITMVVGDTEALTATIQPALAIERTVFWKSSNSSVAEVDWYTGLVTAVGPGSAVITARTLDGGKTASCEVTVTKTAKIPNAVDLGLPSGILWADMNLGAARPEEAGYYYAWAETEPKTNYSWGTYKWCMGTETTLTKYCSDPEYGYQGFVDYRSDLEMEDNVLWEEFGSYTSWSLPGSDNWEELYDECDWEWTTQNGRDGYKITSKNNGNSIFLPAAGVKAGTTLIDRGGYWSYEYNRFFPSQAYCFGLWDEHNGNTHYSFADYREQPRCYGMNIRPIFRR